MSLATSIKDFSDTLNNLHTVNTSSLPILPFLQEIFVFGVRTIISGFLYLVTFEWFRDFSYLPLVNAASPQQLEISNAEHLLFPGLTSSKVTAPFFTNPIFDFFCLSDLRESSTNYILSGVINSFFFSLPFSLPHLISIRRLFSQGIEAAFASLLGNVVAHSLFMISVFYGLRFLIIPWFSLEPITYILGFLLNVLVIKELIRISPRRKANVLVSENNYTNTNTGININSNRFASSPISSAVFKNTGGGTIFSWLQTRLLRGGIPLFSSSLFRISLLSFGLTWCEELNVFSSITHLTLNAQNGYLDLYPSPNASVSLLVHTLYVLSFIVGNCVFSLLFYYLLFKSGTVIASLTNLSTTKVNDTINKLVMLLILTFSFACFPYYGLDYLFGKVGGFLPEDPVYKESVFSPTKINVHKKNTLFFKAESADKKKHTSLLDINNFDNGVYVNNIDWNKWDNFALDSKGSISRTQSFEKSNYRQENAWIRRHYLAKFRARAKKMGDNGNPTSFYKAFKDPHAYYQKLQLESDRKQSKNVRDIQAKNRYGSFVDRQEGVLVDENTSKIQDFWDRILGFPGNDLFQIMKTNKSAVAVNSLPAVQEDTTSLKTERFVTGQENRKIPTERNLIHDPLKAGSLTPLLEINRENDPVDNNELDQETKIFAERYTKGIKQKNAPPLLKRTKSLSTKKIIKRKFFLNPVYRILLETDIDAFMKRQPVMHNIAENQDYDLYRKRVVLERYYNWLRYYSPLQQDLQNLYNISESKSFVDSAFHHQFKGTLKIAKRLFPVTFDSQQNDKKSRVLSYDQTLYKNLRSSENPLLHEELAFTDYQTKQDKSKNTISKPPLYKTEDERSKVIEKNTSSSSKSNEDKSEELDSKLRLQETFPTGNNSPFIEESDISPFYAGWDDTARRFVITNKFLVEKR